MAKKAVKATKPKKTTTFAPETNGDGMTAYTLKVDRRVWERFQARAKQEGRRMNWLLTKFVQEFAEGTVN